MLKQQTINLSPPFNLARFQMANSLFIVSNISLTPFVISSHPTLFGKYVASAIRFYQKEYVQKLFKCMHYQISNINNKRLLSVIASIQTSMLSLCHEPLVELTYIKPH